MKIFSLRFIDPPRDGRTALAVRLEMGGFMRWFLDNLGYHPPGKLTQTLKRRFTMEIELCFRFKRKPKTKKLLLSSKNNSKHFTRRRHSRLCRLYALIIS